MLVVGGGPAGLEAALALGQRGYEVTLAEKSNSLGGRVLNESALPGLGNWIRVRDYREHMISKLAECGGLSRKRHGRAGYCGFWRRPCGAGDGKLLAAGWHWRGAGRRRGISGGA